MIVAHFDADTAARIVGGRQTVATYDSEWATEVEVNLNDLRGQRIGIAREWDHRGRWRPRPAIVGSVTVAAVVPIYEGMNYAVGMLRKQKGLPLADFTPGRYAVIFTDPATCEQRCPACGTVYEIGANITHAQSKAWTECEHCEDTCAPIPYDVDGPFSEWVP